MEFFTALVGLLFKLAVIVIGLIVLWANGPKIAEFFKRRYQVGEIRRTPTLDHVRIKDPIKANVNARGLIGLSGAVAGQMLHNVPTIKPLEEGAWENDRFIVTTSQIKAWAKGGALNTYLYELTGGYFIVVVGNEAYIMNRAQLSKSTKEKLISERKSLLSTYAANPGSEDNQIQNFREKSWTIIHACGTVGPHFCSIEATSTHPKLGEIGFESFLPKELLNGDAHEYADLRAENNDDNQAFIFAALLPEGEFFLLFGRSLEEVEKQTLDLS